MRETLKDTHRMMRAITLLVLMTIFVSVGFSVLYSYTGEPKITRDGGVFLFNLVGMAIISSIVVVAANIAIANRVVVAEQNLSNWKSLVVITIEVGLLSEGVSFPAVYAMGVVPLFVFLADKSLTLPKKNISFPTARVVN